MENCTILKKQELNNRHFIAVIGGSVSGSEAVNLLTAQNFNVVVFDMNKLPYGKLEDGLPNWHHNLRDRQIELIDERLKHKNVYFIPNTKIGKDLTFDELKNNWGFSSIILANGSWKDRDLPVNGINQYIDNGLIYQNALIYWFNHKHEKNYNGPFYELKNNTLVVGGGLASLDVMKIIMIELVQKSMKTILNIELDMLTIEKQGINVLLAQYSTSLKELNIIPPTLVYRRNAADMPLKSPKDDTPENIAKAKEVSQKLLEKYVEKYLFNFIPYSSPIGFFENEGKLTGMKFMKMKTENGKLIPSNETFEIYTDLVISSIGSIPEQIKNLYYEGDALKLKDNSSYTVFGFENVFAIGNAVTGKGNIQDSKQHGKQMTEKIIADHLNEDALESWVSAFNEEIRENTALNVATLIHELEKSPIPTDEKNKLLLTKIKLKHNELGYKDYASWIHEHLPERIEDII